MKLFINFTHGLGDAVQLTSVLQHLQKYRPEAELYLRARRGKQSVGHGYCRKVWHDQEKQPSSQDFDVTYDLGWWENYNAYSDVPCTKVTNCLREVFKLQPDPALLNYKLHVSHQARLKAQNYLRSLGLQPSQDGRFPVVLFHYEGNTSTHKKNLDHGTAAAVVHTVLDLGRTPIILDWDKRSPLPNGRTIHNPGVGKDDIWGRTGTGDAEVLTALIEQVQLFVGIDSGPQKCAGATDTPSIGVWTHHSPLQFMDLCPNFLHLVPEDHHRIPPCNKPGPALYFKKHYQHDTYKRQNLTAKLVDTIMSKLGTTPPAGNQLRRLAGFHVPSANPEQSWVIINDIYNNDAYKTRLRPKRDGVEYVVDLGANIGCFTKLWHNRNPKAVIAAVEINPALIPALTANVGQFATVINAACHYDRDPLFLLDSISPTGKSTGGSRVVTRLQRDTEKDPQYNKSDTPLKTITLEEIAHQLRMPRIDVLKLDVEGSEFSILENCDLSKVGTIFLESHGAARWRKLMERKFPKDRYHIGHMSAHGEFENWHIVRKDLAEWQGPPTDPFDSNTKSGQPNQLGLWPM